MAVDPDNREFLLATRTCSTPGSPPRCGRSRRSAGRTNAGAQALLPDQRARHRLRHHLLLGRPHDDDGPALHEGGAVPRPSTSTRSCATRRAPRCRSRRATSSTRSASSTIYGADALRFTLASMAAQGRDIKLSPQRVEGERNFATKLWNAARFAEMNGCATRTGLRSEIRKGSPQPLDRARDCARRAGCHGGARGLPFQRGGGAVRAFVWNVFCDWYLELAKPVLTGPGRRRQDRDAGDGRLGARRNPQAAAPVHAVPHRGAVGGDGQRTARARSLLALDARGRASPGSTTREPKPRSAGWSISSPRSARCAPR